MLALGRRMGQGHAMAAGNFRPLIPETHDAPKSALSEMTSRERPIRMLSLSHRFLFVHIPKTAGNSIQRILSPYSEDQIVTHGFQDGVERFEVRGRFTRHKHATLADYHAMVPAEIFADLFKFCVVRNPWSRSVSFYFSPHHWIRRGVAPYWSREGFLAILPRLMPMVDFLRMDGAVQKMDAVVRYESLGEQLPRVLSQIGIDSSRHRLSRVNRGSGGDYRDYFKDDAELIRIVGERYREDVERFGYTFPL